MPSASLLHHCVRVASNAACRAGELLEARVGRPHSVSTKRNAIDLVTEVDRAAERLLHRTILGRFPDHGYLGEERTRTNPGAPFQWIVDPLDGTMNFVHGTPLFAISIGLQHEGRLVAGVIYDPLRRELFTAVCGGGARLNGRRIRVAATRRLAEGLVSTGFSGRFRAHAPTYLRWFRAFEERSHGVRRIGSTALSLAYVACGRLDGFYEQRLWPWDLAAGIVLVEEAGGGISDFHGQPARLDRGEAVASNGAIHRSMLALLR